MTDDADQTRPHAPPCRLDYHHADIIISLIATSDVTENTTKPITVEFSAD